VGSSPKRRGVESSPASKRLFIPNILFEQLGFTLFRPVDGHDLFAVEGVLEKARDFRDGPVFVHGPDPEGSRLRPGEDDKREMARRLSQRVR